MGAAIGPAKPIATAMLLVASHIQAALNGAIEIWRIAKDRSAIGAEGAGPLVEAQARANMYKLRVMWLKENANGKP